MSGRAGLPRPANWTAQLIGFVRKELVEIVRQPRLLLVMVLGPFIVLFLFAAGFDQQQTVLRTMFVGPADGPYEASVEEFADELSRYIDSAGYSTDLVAATTSLEDGDIDLIVVFPDDPVNSLLSGERAVISVLHDKIDPIQQTTVEVSAEVAVQELNATILETVVGEAQSALVPYATSVDEAADLLGELDEAVAGGDESDARRALDALAPTADAITAISEVSQSLANELGAPEEQLTTFDDLATSAGGFESAVARLSALSDDLTADDVTSLRELFDVVVSNGDVVTTLEPRVVVRPFDSDTANLERRAVSIESFFAAGAMALLLQHMVLTFAALSLVTDRSLGLFEIFQVGPTGPGRVLIGKFVAYLAVGGVVGAALFVTLRTGLGVPMRGSMWWLAPSTFALLLASIGLGTLISLIATSDTQAIQYALLVLLASLFFSGFFLDLDAFRYPFKAVSWLLPVTYGTNVFRDVMLRGDDPAIADIVGLATTTAVYCAASWMLFANRLKVK